MALTGRTERRTPWTMPPPDKAPKDPASEREAKLAQALRANLRRRKTGANPQAEESRQEKSEPKS
jgi:hypothetical protein